MAVGTTVRIRVRFVMMEQPSDESETKERDEDDSADSRPSSNCQFLVLRPHRIDTVVG